MDKGRAELKQYGQRGRWSILCGRLLWIMDIFQKTFFWKFMLQTAFPVLWLLKMT